MSIEVAGNALKVYKESKCCPACGSGDTNVGFDHSENDVTSRFEHACACRNCGRHWLEHWTIVQVQMESKAEQRAREKLEARS